jgi:hypothetical protein
MSAAFFFFLFEFLLFIFPVLLHWLGIPRLHWIKAERAGTLIWFLTLDEMVSVFFPLIWFGYRHAIYSFCYIEVIPSIPSFIRAFIMKEWWFLSKAFFASIEMVIWFLSLLLLICCNTFYDLCIWNHPYIPGLKLTLIMVYDLFDMLLNSVCLYFIENFCI